MLGTWIDIIGGPDGTAVDTTAEDGTAEDATAELFNLGWTLQRSHQKTRYSDYHGRYGGLGLGLGYRGLRLGLGFGLGLGLGLGLGFRRSGRDNM